ncbi:MAG: KpsF/GutQ family sugar-phosphate isomerase [Pseudomonadota bacterium]
MDVGRRVLHAEANALTAFAGALDSDFVQAVELIESAKGRVILSGMGKSGHVARKIAATLASNGTPSFYVHPAEASHGDLGMITRDDVAIVLSNSGETRELADVLTHCKRFQIPMIGVASKANSTLLRAADIALVLPPIPEACSVGMAPTTSTTMTMALGDALAVALMERRAFTTHDFSMFHPGGKLGAQLLKVSDLMHTGEEMPLVSQETPMSDVLVEMSAKGFGIVGVTDDTGVLSGVVTDGDLRRNMDGLLTRFAADVATPSPKTITMEALASEALALMNAPRRALCLFVFATQDDPRPVGILHVHDCLRAGVDGG